MLLVGKICGELGERCERVGPPRGEGAVVDGNIPMPAKAQCEGDTGRENAVFTVRDDGPARVDCRRVAVGGSTAEEGADCGRVGVECSGGGGVAGWQLQQRLEGNIDPARDVPRTRVTGVSRERLPRQPPYEGCFVVGLGATGV